MPFTARELEQITELAIQDWKYMDGIEDVLGFSPPKWVDETMHRRGINRRRDSPEKIRNALLDTATEERNKVRRKILEAAESASRLGYTVVAEDLREAWNALGDSFPDIHRFFSYNPDPRKE